MAERASFYARDRAMFLLSLVPYLEEHGSVPVGRVAADFGVDADYVRQIVRFLGTAGIPGETATYQSNDLFDIDWDALEEDDEVVLTNRIVLDDAPRFSVREAAALIAGLQYLGSLPEFRSSEALGSLLAKLGGAARDGAVPLVGVAPTGPRGPLAELAGAIESGHVVEFDYRSLDGPTRRRAVDPIRIESVDAHWYLRAWCHLREGVRVFRVDRMSAIAVTDDPVGERAATESDDDAAFFRPTDDDTVVLLEIRRDALPALADYALREVGEGATDQSVRAELRVPHLHGLKRLVSSMSDSVRVLEPASARRAVVDWADSGLAERVLSADAV